MMIILDYLPVNFSLLVTSDACCICFMYSRGTHVKYAGFGFVFSAPTSPDLTCYLSEMIPSELRIY